MEYRELVKLYDDLNNTSKRLEKTYLISEFLKKTSEKDIKDIILLIRGRIFPEWNRTEIGISTRLVMKAIATASGTSMEKVELEWKRTGDLGDAGTSLLKKGQQMSLFQEELSTEEIVKDLKKVAIMEGHGSTDQKTKLISKLLNSASNNEVKYIIRTVLEDMRTGASEGILRDAICWAFFREEAKIIYGKGTLDVVKDEDREHYNEYIDLVQNAIDMTNDFPLVAETAKKEGEEGLKKIDIILGKPIKVMLYPKAVDVKDAFSIVGEKAVFEYKYDGFRLQIHKRGEDITIFTRRLDNVTSRFPDIIRAVKKHIKAKDCILDGEVVGYDKDNGKYLPFQSISQRIRRKYNIEEMAKKFPVELNLFDIIYIDGKNLLKEPFIRRREILEKNVEQEEKKLLLAKQIITNDEKKANDFYKEALKQGFEGIMAKSLEGPYKPGRKVGYGVKLKPVMEELDLVITKAEWGTGKRGKWLTSYTVGFYDDEGEIVEIGKVSSGLKELESEAEGGNVTFNQMTETLKPLIIKEEGKEAIVKPEVIIEVHYEEIQKSPTYSSGYALRFPRIIRVRDDKGLDELATYEQIDKLFKKQRS